MALTKQDGEINSSDLQTERLGAGTVTGEHVQRRTLSANRITSIIDDSDPSIIYGLASGYPGPNGFTIMGSEAYASNGTQTVLGGVASTTGAGSCAQYTFTGKSIGILGGTNPYSGVMKVYIDGVLTPGRAVISCTLHVPSSSNAYAVNIGDTTINVVGGNGGFPSSGTLLIGKEQIPYTGKTGSSFTGCTVTQPHTTQETVYLMTAAIDLSTTTDYGVKRLLYFNPFLEDRQHTITVVCDKSPVSGYTGVYFDGFVVGSLIGSKSIFSQLNTFTVTLTTSANGHADIGQIVPFNNDISPLALLGYTQTNCETDNANVMGRIGVRYQQDGQPFYYYHNGPASTTVTVVLTFAYLGEST